MRVLITGGAGFIGSHLSDEHLRRGHKVHVLDNLVTGRKSNVAHLLDNPNFTYTEGNILDEHKLLECIGACDVVVDEVYGAIAKVKVMPQAMQQLINNPFILCVQLHWTISLSERRGVQEENCPKLGFSGLGSRRQQLCKGCHLSRGCRCPQGLMCQQGRIKTGSGGGPVEIADERLRGLSSALVSRVTVVWGFDSCQRQACRAPPQRSRGLVIFPRPRPVGPLSPALSCF